MEPPLKRARLSVFGRRQSEPDDALAAARLNNDLALKSRFEAIFEKYSHDFSDVGDEIDIHTGKIIVDRGHVARMETETDTGPPSKYGHAVSVASMLHAVTDIGDENPDTEPDVILQSIETITEDAGLIDDLSSDQNDSDFIDISDVESRSESTTRTSYQDDYPVTLHPYESDEDSLFEQVVEDRNARAASVDSLFDAPAITIDTAGLSEDQAVDDNHILGKFGPVIGQQVLSLLDQQRDAHIEPEWRIPVRIGPSVVHSQKSRVVSSTPSDFATEQFVESSLWKGSVQTRKARSKRTSDKREDSEDPLQEGFSDDQEQFENGEDERGTLGDLVTNKVYCELQKGQCLYCGGDYDTKTKAMAHWDRVLDKSTKFDMDLDPHDLDAMTEIRRTALRRTKLPRLVLYDFRAMVEMHEGANMNFADIARSGILRSRKDGLWLQDLYEKHRTIPHPSRSPELTVPWSRAEEQVLHELCKNSLVTMATLGRELGRPEMIIGNKLADMWLAQLKNADTMDTLQLPSGVYTENVVGYPYYYAESIITRTPNTVMIKEESIDDLVL